MLISIMTIAGFGLIVASVSAQTATCTTPAILDTQTNIWKTRSLHPTSLYRQEVEQAVAAIKDEGLKQMAAKVADVGTFLWRKSPEDIETVASIADEVPCDEILGLVLDHLPYKTAMSDTLAPEYDPDTETVYQSLYIKPLADTILAHPNTAFAVIIEPSAFPQYFNATMATPKPSKHETNLMRSYDANIPVALRELDLPNVVMYLDAGHSNSLDWSWHRNATAAAIVCIYEDAGSPMQLRGFATNVANWNAWNLSPGEFARADDSRDIRPSNEHNFIQILSAALIAHHMPVTAAHAILDSSRNAVAGLRWDWDEWCNVDGAGLGIRSGANTGDEDGNEDALDAFVWAKRPGESDGVSSERGGDEMGCAAKSAVRPAPQRDVWFQAYFEMLVTNASPNL